MRHGPLPGAGMMGDMGLGPPPVAAARLMPHFPVRTVTWASVAPSCPACPPGLRPLLFRSDRFLGPGLPRPSLDGGLEEFREFCFSRASSSAIRSRARCNSPRASASSLRSDTASAASTSNEGGP
jgi:hypothetical protein